MKPTIVAMTGASGAVYGIRLVKALAELGHEIALVISEAARLVIKEEIGISLKGYAQCEAMSELFGDDIATRVTAYSPKDLAAPIASGSYPTEGMVIVPCSMGTLGALASGVCQNLIHRAADCTLKEGRKLVLVPRETPLSAIHLENMLKLSRLGVRIVPAMPGFYSGTPSVEGMIDFVVGKTLDQLGIVHSLYPRWVGTNG